VAGLFYWRRVKRHTTRWFSATALKAVDPAVYFLLIGGILITLFPFYWMVLTSLKPYKEASRFSLQPTFYPGQKYVEEAWNSAPFPENLGPLAETLDQRVFQLWRQGWEEAQAQFALAQTAPWTVEPGNPEWMARDYYGDALARVLHGFLPNYEEAWNSFPFALYFRNSVFVALCIVGGVLVTAALAGYAFARMEFLGRDVIFILFLSTMMIPFEVIMIPNYVIVNNLGWYNDWPALIVPFIVNVFSVFLFRQFFMTIPKDLHDAALIDGCGHIRFLTQIILPLSKPAVITVLLVVRRTMRLEYFLRPEHFDALAKLVLIFSFAWTYFFFNDYLVEWYGGDWVGHQLLLFQARGPIAPLWYAMLCFNIVIPWLTLWNKRIRRSPIALFLITVGINIGMYLERVIIIPGFLQRNALPFSWGEYAPQWPEVSIALGTLALFILLYVLASKFIPLIPVWEVLEGQLSHSRRRIGRTVVTSVAELE